MILRYSQIRRGSWSVAGMVTDRPLYAIPKLAAATYKIDDHGEDCNFVHYII